MNPETQSARVALPVIQLPPARVRVRDWGSIRAAWWQRVLFFALIFPVAIPIHLLWRLLDAGWQVLWPGPAEHSSELRDGRVYWFERGRVTDVYEHQGSPSANLPKQPK